MWAPAQYSFLSVKTAFTPRQLPGLIAWYRADAEVYNNAGTTLATDGQTVQQWNDLSGNGYHLSQATAANRPTFSTSSFNSRSGVTSPVSGDDFMKSAATALNFGASSSPFSVFVVVRPLADVSSNEAIISLWDGTGADHNETTSIVPMGDDSTFGSPLAVLWNSGVHCGTSMASSTNHRLATIFDGTNLTIYKNNVAGTPATQSVALAQNLSLIVWTRSDEVRFWPATIAEIVICKQATSSINRVLLDDYFKVKWGL